MHIKSLKKFLTISISITIIISGIINIIWTYKYISYTNYKFFDALLLESSEKLKIFLTGVLTTDHLKQIQKEIDKCDSSTANENCIFKLDQNNPSDQYLVWEEKIQQKYKENSVFQVWSIKPEKLLLHSSNINYNVAAIILDNKLTPGFHDIECDKQKWRVYTYVNPASNMLIHTAQLYDMREYLASNSRKQQIYPMLIFIPIVILLIIFTINLAINSINIISRSIKKREPRNLNLLNTTYVPKEISPLILELNRLFKLINSAFEREQRFNSDAAHELKTPLAAIKTQAEVALKTLTTTNNIEVMTDNLNKIITAVNNSNHMVSQLLILSKLAPERKLGNAEPCYLDKISREIIADLINHANTKNITIELNIINFGNSNDNSVDVPAIMGNKILLAILIRNIIDNAIKYSNNHGGLHIKIIINKINKQLILEVTDEGPGLPDVLKQRIFDRFYRQPGTNTEGSGLGLSIVKLIADLHNATIKVSDNNYAKHGLCMQIIFLIDQTN